MKVAQIAVAAATGPDSWDRLFALADDGSLWFFDIKDVDADGNISNANWHPIPPIPEESESEER